MYLSTLDNLGSVDGAEPSVVFDDALDDELLASAQPLPPLAPHNPPPQHQPQRRSCACDLILLGVASLLGVAAAGVVGCVFGYLGWRIADHALEAPSPPDEQCLRTARALCMAATFLGAIIALAILTMAILGLTSPALTAV